MKNTLEVKVARPDVIHMPFTVPSTARPGDVLTLIIDLRDLNRTLQALGYTIVRGASI